jgi:hypothetical protein
MTESGRPSARSKRLSLDQTAPRAPLGGLSAKASAHFPTASDSVKKIHLLGGMRDDRR